MSSAGMSRAASRPSRSEALLAQGLIAMGDAGMSPSPDPVPRWYIGNAEEGPLTTDELF
jgi:hypothetical protein